MKIKECPDCVSHLFTNPGIVEACASVALDTPYTTKQLLVRYLSAYHQEDHDQDRVEQRIIDQYKEV